MEFTVFAVVAEAVSSTHGGVTVTVSVQVTETTSVSKIVDDSIIVDVDSVAIIFSPCVI
jgi:hypothetical protein